MKDGYWINYKTGKDFPIDEHERWIRKPANAKKLGLSKELMETFENFTPKRDRNKFLLFLMKHAPIMRVRGHGHYVTFEYSSRRRNPPIESAWLWGMENAGPFTTMRITNFATNETVEMSFKQLDELMESGGAEAVMRVAKDEGTIREAPVQADIAAELREIAKEIRTS